MKTNEPNRILFILTYLYPFYSGLVVYVVLYLLDKNRTSIRLRISALQAVILGIVDLLLGAVVTVFLGVAFSVVIIYIPFWFYGLYIGYEAYHGNDVSIPTISQLLRTHYKYEVKKSSIGKNLVSPKMPISDWHTGAKAKFDISLYPPKTKKSRNKKGISIKPLEDIDPRIKKYLEKDEKVLSIFNYLGGREFTRGQITRSIFLNVLFVATDKRIIKIRYGFLLPETVNDISYDVISAVYLDNLYGVSFYQLTMNANKTVIRRANEDSDYQEETDSFKIKPVRWRILDVTKPEVKDFVNVVRENMAGDKAREYTL